MTNLTYLGLQNLSNFVLQAYSEVIFRFTVWSVTVLHKKFMDIDRKVQHAWKKITANHDERLNSRQTPKFTVCVISVNSSFLSSPSNQYKVHIQKEVSSYDKFGVIAFCQATSPSYQSRHWKPYAFTWSFCQVKWKYVGEMAQHLTLTLGTSTVEATDVVRVLGVFFTSDLTTSRQSAPSIFSSCVNCDEYDVHLTVKVQSY